jgi:DNA-binding CsgD family transcriptional regulator
MKLIGVLEASQSTGLSIPVLRELAKNMNLDSCQTSKGQLRFEAKDLDELKSLFQNGKTLEKINSDLQKQIEEAKYLLKISKLFTQNKEREEAMLHILSLLFKKGHRELYIFRSLLDGKSFKEIGNSLELTSERVRQIFRKALREMKSFGNQESENKILRDSIIDLQIENKKLKYSLTIKKIKDGEKDHIEQSVLDFLEKPIRESSLSVRSQNVLLRNGIKTVYDLLRRKYEDLYMLKTLGVKTYNEILEFKLSFYENLQKQ